MADARTLTDGFHLVVDALKLNGLDTIFGVPGIPVSDLARLAQNEGIRVISFRHEQSAGNAAAIAGYLTQKPGICLTVSAPGFLNGLVSLAAATTNGFPMIQISGSSERAIIDLQQGDYEELDQMNAAKPYAKASYRVNAARGYRHRPGARDPRRGVGPAGRRLSRSSRQCARRHDGRRRGHQIAGARGRRRAAPASRRRIGRARGGPARPGAASARHPRQGRGVRARGRGNPRLHRAGRDSVPAHVDGERPAARRASALRRRGPLFRAERGRRRDAGRCAAELAARPRQAAAMGARRAIRAARHPGHRDGQQPPHRRARGRRHRVLHGRDAGRAGAPAGAAPRRLARRDRRAQGDECQAHGAAPRRAARSDGVLQRARRHPRRARGAQRRLSGQRRRQHARHHAQRPRHVGAAHAAGHRHLGRDGRRHGLCHRGLR